MIRLRFRIPVVGTEPPTLQNSPCCRTGLIRHQKGHRGLTDIRVGGVDIQRYMCKGCGKTFTVRPPGVTRSSVSDRVKAAAALAYCLGLSYDSVCILLSALGAPISKGSAYNYTRAAGQVARRLHQKAGRGELWAVGQDTTVFKVKGKKLITSIITDALKGNTVRIDFLDKEDAESLKECIRKAGGRDLKLLITDDADAYKQVAERLGVPHQLCTCHARRAFVRRASAIASNTATDNPYRAQILKDCKWLKRAMGKGKKLTMRLWNWSKERLSFYARGGPPVGGQRASPQYRMRLMLTDLVERGLQLFTYRRFKDAQGRLLLDGTNNATERAIGWCGKIRYRQMRGAKNTPSLRDFLHLNAFLWERKLSGQATFNWATLLA